MEVYSTVVKGTQNDNFAPMENKAGESSIPNTAIECFSKILLEERFCDVIFHVGPSEEKIKAHRSFLMARSEVFEAQFRGDWENSDRILLPQFEPTAFRSFLKFTYTDQVDLDGTNWMRLLEVGHYFLVKPLVNICVETGFRDASSDINKALEGFQTVRLYDYKERMYQIGQFMAVHFVELCKTENFEVKVDDETLFYLLRLDHLRVDECELFKTILSVAKARAGMQDENNEAVTVATEMKKFLPLIRIPTMTVHEFRTVVDASRVLPAEDVNQFYRFFTTTDAEERNAIASTWTYNDLKRGYTQRKSLEMSHLMPELEAMDTFEAVHRGYAKPSRYARGKQPQLGRQLGLPAFAEAQRNRGIASGATSGEGDDMGFVSDRMYPTLRI